MKTIKRFEPLSVMKIAAICYAILGLVEGAFVALIFSAAPFAANDSPGFPKFLGPLFGVGSLIFFPIIFAIIGAIGGGLGAVIYNVSARFVGGIQVEVE